MVPSTRLLLVVVSCVLFTLASAACPAEALAERPSLVVVVSVDQWRYEYFERFRAKLEGGIAQRCREEGVWFDNCFHQHALTYTGPGHAVLLTGAFPCRNGIIGNDWYDVSTGARVYCVEDRKAQLIGTTGEDTPVSPQMLLVDTVGDQLKLAMGSRSKVFGLAIKDRAAILMAGHAADAAYWMSNDGNWITSNYYANGLPGYIRELNTQRAPYRFAGETWDLLLPRNAYVHGTTERSDHERPLYSMLPNFPHALPPANGEYYIRNLACSPFGNEATLEAARAVIESESLGQDEYPDLLAINLSSNDYVGHSFGPDSLEVEDMTYRTDRQLGEFAEYLDARVNREQSAGEPRSWVMFVTSDHGVAPIPEVAAKAGIKAVRDPFGPQVTDAAGSIEVARQRLEGYLRATMELAGDSEPPLVKYFDRYQVVLNQNHPALGPTSLPHLRTLTCDWLRRHEFVAYAATREQLQDAGTGDALSRLMRNSFHAARHADVLFVLAPYHFTGTAGSDHGSPWGYDRHVPLMVLGSERWTGVIEPGSETSPAMIAPTIARLLAIEAPSACMVSPLNITPARPNRD